MPLHVMTQLRPTMSAQRRFGTIMAIVSGPVSNVRWLTTSARGRFWSVDGPTSPTPTHLKVGGALVYS